MILAACVDNRMGLRFGGRRQSRDRVVTAKLLELAGPRLLVSPDSGRLFADSEKIVAAEDFLQQARPEDWVFAEDDGYLEVSEKIEKIVLFRWNRDYPGDVFFTFPGQWQLMDSQEFPGSSHEKITMEVYIK